jgi:hypothetical protein
MLNHSHALLYDVSKKCGPGKFSLGNTVPVTKALKRDGV